MRKNAKNAIFSIYVCDFSMLRGVLYFYGKKVPAFFNCKLEEKWKKTKTSDKKNPDCKYARGKGGRLFCSEYY